MEMRKGYKQTEVGVIPEDWAVKKLGELVSLRTGPFGSSVHKSDYVNGGIPFINPTHIFNGKLFPDRDITVSSETVARLSEFQLRTNDIIMGRRGEMGRCAVVKESQQGWLCGSGSMTLRPTSKIVPEFLQRVISSPLVIKKIEETSVGSTMINLNQAIVNGLPITYPPLAEQEAIAEVLSDADALIESLETLLAKKRQVKQGTMSELLSGKRRLVESPTGRLRTGEWEVKRLGDIAEIVMGQSPSSAFYNTKGEGIPLIQGNADIRERKTIKRIFTSQVTKRGKYGDILMSVRAPVGEISRAMFDVCLGRGVCAIRYPNNFLYHALIAKEPKWASLSKGSTFDSVNSTDIKEFKIEMPSSEAEQTAIAEILSDMDAEIRAVEEKLSKARAVKAGMMSALLTGRIRLNRDL